MKLNKKRIVIFSFVQLLALVVFFGISFSAGMDAFDGKREITKFDEFSGFITEVLMSPAFLLWNSWASKNVPNIIENLLVILNSILWGTIIEFFYSKYRNSIGGP